MPERAPDSLQDKIEERLRYYEDLGIRLFYRDRQSSAAAMVSLDSEPAVAAPTSVEEISLPKPRVEAKTVPGPVVVLQEELSAKSAGTSIFEHVEKTKDDSLLTIRADIGDCTRCKLHKARTNIVFGVGSVKAELVFVGEGPGHDEDIKGEPFVGRAGKLLTQMIQAMGLRREDVYICNVVKCRPPENRLPEKEEITTCSPFLFRQIDVIRPKVICALGSCASQTLLQTTQGISRFRGEWFDFRGSKLIATYHPAYLLRNPSAKSEVWKDLQKVMAVLGLQPKRK